MVYKLIITHLLRPPLPSLSHHLATHAEYAPIDAILASSPGTFVLIYEKSRRSKLPGELARMATMRCARRHARGHQLQRCRYRVGWVPSSLPSVAKRYKEENHNKLSLFTLICRLVKRVQAKEHYRRLSIYIHTVSSRSNP